MKATKHNLLAAAALILALGGLTSLFLKKSPDENADSTASEKAKLTKSALEQVPNEMKSQICEFKLSKAFWDLLESEKDPTVQTYLQHEVQMLKSQREENQACQYDAVLEIYTTAPSALLVLSLFEVKSKNKIFEISETQTAKKNPDDFSSGSK